MCRTEIYKMFQEYSEIEIQKSGWIEIITGSMFSGKTEELIRRIQISEISEPNVKVFKPKVDNRYAEDEIVTHSKVSIKCVSVESSSELFRMARNSKIVGIDEAQFFDEGIIKVCNDLANMGIRVIVAGLDMDFLGNPFGPMPNLMAVAEFVTKVHAKCSKTGELANFSHRLNPDGKTIQVGGEAAYEAVSRFIFKEMLNK